ncbi:2-dehydropantoate 2-reductase [Rossellomorea sp. RS05]|uniref:ketopantoate reductase family protein n=1 Tax=Rossellomorea sp. RS05 TaxID=3149166 RepID=UPI00322203CA
MDIGIIGAGAVGLLFAGYLGKRHDVTVYARRNEQREHLETSGVTVWREGRKEQTDVGVKSLSSLDSQHDLVILAVKGYDLIESLFITVPTETPLLFLQNGIGHLDFLKTLPHDTVMAASVEHGALKENDYTVLHKGVGVTKIALVRGVRGPLQCLMKDGDEAFPFEEEEDYETMLLRKLFINAAINPLTAITGCVNGEMRSNPHYNALIREVYEELLHLYPHMEAVISLEDIESICLNTAQNRSSMLMDMENGRKTEVESILGEIIRKASPLDIPVIHTLYLLVKGKESAGRQT